MKKTVAATLAALFLTTSLVGPARANDDLIRMGVGLGIGLIGKAIEGGKNRQGQPRRGDKMIGRVDGRQPAQERTANRNRKAAPAAVAGAATAGAVAFALPEGDAIPTPLAKPTAEEMMAWLADAPQREQAEGEMALGADMELRGAGNQIDTTTTAATTGQGQFIDGQTHEMVDEQGRVWGVVDNANAEKVNQLLNLGIPRSQAFKAVGLSEPKAAQQATTADAEGIDLIDEQGRLWGNVPDDVADRVWKAVDLGMSRSAAFAALSGLPSPEAKAQADAAGTTAKTDEDAKLATWCLEEAQLITPMTQCRPYKDQQKAAWAAIKAEREADAKRTAEDRARAIEAENEQRVAKAKAEADAKAFADLLNAAPAAAIVEAEKPAVVAVDEGKTAAIETPAKIEATADKPEAKPVEKTKPKLKLDL